MNHHPPRRKEGKKDGWMDGWMISGQETVLRWVP